MTEPQKIEQPPLVRQWQVKLDASFPDGMVLTWDVPESDVRYTKRYFITHAEVIGQEGFDPVVVLPVFNQDKLFRVRVLTYEVKNENPLVAHVTTDDAPNPMWWSAGVSGWAKSQMAATRLRLVAFMDRTGQSIFA